MGANGPILLGWALVVCTFVGCGGSSSTAGGAEGSGGPGSCPSESPCGGDVVGTWALGGGCVEPSGPPGMGSSCDAQESLSVSSVNASGKIVFNADMTFAANFDVAVDETDTLPQSCAGGTCDDRASVLNMTFQAAGGSATHVVTCSATGSSCSCPITLDVPVAETGMYSVSGNTFMLGQTTPAGLSAGGGYCVQGDTLRLFGFGGLLTNTEITATRQ